MIAFRYEETTKEFAGIQECQIDPLESAAGGYDEKGEYKTPIYLTPANCTRIEPTQKEGFAPVFNGAAWNLVEDHRGEFYYPKDAQWNSPPVEMKELGKIPEGATFEPPLKPESVINAERVAELKAKLSDTDYVVIKIAEGRATKEQYAQVLADRESWREEIRSLEN